MPGDKPVVSAQPFQLRQAFLAALMVAHDGIDAPLSQVEEIGVAAKTAVGPTADASAPSSRPCPPSRPPIPTSSPS